MRLRCVHMWGLLALRLSPTGGSSTEMRLSDHFQKLHFGVKRKLCKWKKNPKGTYLGTCPVRKSREVGEVVKVRRSAQRSKPTAQQWFGPRGTSLGTWHWHRAGSIQPAVLGGHSSVGTGKGGPSTTSQPQLPSHHALCMHHSGETDLIGWLWLGVLCLWAVQGRSSSSSPPDQLQATAEGN